MDKSTVPPARCVVVGNWPAYSKTLNPMLLDGVAARLRIASQRPYVGRAGRLPRTADMVKCQQSAPRADVRNDALKF
jgi:hypothetical protein